MILCKQSDYFTLLRLKFDKCDKLSLTTNNDPSELEQFKEFTTRIDSESATIIGFYEELKFKRILLFMIIDDDSIDINGAYSQIELKDIYDISAQETDLIEIRRIWLTIDD